MVARRCQRAPCGRKTGLVALQRLSAPTAARLGGLGLPCSLRRLRRQQPCPQQRPALPACRNDLSLLRAQQTGVGSASTIANGWLRSIWAKRHDVGMQLHARTAARSKLRRQRRLWRQLAPVMCLALPSVIDRSPPPRRSHRLLNVKRAAAPSSRLRDCRLLRSSVLARETGLTASLAAADCCCSPNAAGTRAAAPNAPRESRQQQRPALRPFQVSKTTSSAGFVPGLASSSAAAPAAARRRRRRRDGGGRCAPALHGDLPACFHDVGLRWGWMCTKQHPRPVRAIADSRVCHITSQRPHLT